ncbi:hypothetical protein VS877_22590, partial [Salmonella enterica subsp. enterica serovar Paratyphi A]|nr:hypothetical protein [Salmonella enterica subsp. enterica serovar Paratyphi A]
GSGGGRATKQTGYGKSKIPGLIKRQLQGAGRRHAPTTTSTSEVVADAPQSRPATVNQRYLD